MNTANALLRIDAHHHVWRLARGDYGWLTPALAAIHRDYALDDLRPWLDRAGIRATVLVQAAPTVAETEFLLAAAAASAGIVRGVVGWVDLAAPDAIPTLERLRRDPTLRGVRPMLQDLADRDWIARPEVRRTLSSLPTLGLRFDALVTPRELPALLRTLDREPEVAVVVDHGAKPPIAAGRREPWASLIAAVAVHPHVHCKLSGLATEAGSDWSADTLQPWVDHLIECFGPERLLWGSDWPVVDLAGGYGRWFEATEALLAPLTAEDRVAILGGNAARFYGFESRTSATAISGL
jgi:L-fuconolactonase